MTLYLNHNSLRYPYVYIHTFKRPPQWNRIWETYQCCHCRYLVNTVPVSWTSRLWSNQRPPSRKKGQEAPVLKPFFSQSGQIATPTERPWEPLRQRKLIPDACSVREREASHGERTSWMQKGRLTITPA